MDLPASHNDFKKLQFTVTSPIPPSPLPGANIELDWGKIFHAIHISAYAYTQFICFTYLLVQRISPETYNLQM